MRPASREAGFTLVELLVVLAIFGLMSVLLSGGLQSLGRVAGTGTHQLDRASALVLTGNFLHRIVADARPLPDDTGDGILFDGSADGLRFTGAPPVHLARGGFYAERIALEGAGGARQLVFHAQADGDAQASRSILLDEVASAEFGYFGRAARGEQPVWHDRWPGVQGLPALIRLKIRFTDGTVAPDFIIAPRPAQTGFQ